MATDAAKLLYGLVVDDQGTRWGERASVIQRRDAAALLATDGARRHWISRSRGYSKTDDLAAITVAVLLEQLPAGSEANGAAGDRDQARLLVDRIRFIAARTPELAGALDVGAYTVTTATGTKFEALAADAPSSWGRTPAWVVVDELCQWPETQGARTLWESITTAAVKVPGSRLVVITTSGDPAHWSRRVYEFAVADESWRVSDTHGPAPWLDPVEVEAERRRLPDSSFARLFLNEWAAGEDRLLSYEDVLACATLPGRLEPEFGTGYVIGVDLGLRRDSAVIAVCHGLYEPSGVTVVLDRLDVFSPGRGRDVDLEAVERHLVAMSRRYYQALILADVWQAAQMLQRLRRQGLRAVEATFSAGENSRRTLALLELVRGRRLRIPNDDELVAELAALRLRETSPGVFRYDHSASGHDDRATALALCAARLLEQRPWWGLGLSTEELLAQIRAPRPALMVGDYRGDEPPTSTYKGDSHGMDELW